MPPRKKKETLPPAQTDSSNIGKAILMSMLVTAVLVTVIMYNWHSNVLKDTKVSSLSSCVDVADANAKLQKQTEDLQAQVTLFEEEKAKSEELMQIRTNPKDGWEIYVPKQIEDSEEMTASELIGKSVEEVRELLGEPPVLLRNAPTNEIWVYHTTSEDATGLYVVFTERKVTDVRLDEFNGLDALPSML